MTSELRDTRVLGALRFTDVVTSIPIDAPLAVTASGVRWIRNRRATYVVAAAPGLDAHVASFAAAPNLPAPGSVRVDFTVDDPAGRWLSRTGTLLLPRDADPSHAAQATSLFTIADVPLYPAPAAPTQRGWAIVRGSVQGAAPNSTLAGALVRAVRDSDGARIGAGMSDARGEVLVAVEGIPSTGLGDDDGPVVASEIAVHLDVVWDPVASPPANPDDLEARRNDLLVRSTSARLASGRVLTMPL